MGVEPSDYPPHFIYPEVSAGVQGFVRSRLSEPGMYFFSDTGARTVDQSVFILNRAKKEDDRLVYLNANVYPIGSSHIEQIACELSGESGAKALEKWRLQKEAADQGLRLRQARDQIGECLVKATSETVYGAQHKLLNRAQLLDIQALFGGGGHTNDPYKTYALRGFKHRAISVDDLEPEVIGMQLPDDLAPEDKLELWMPRLWVAYGLSFERSELATSTYPCDVDRPEPVNLWPDQKRTIQAMLRGGV